MGAKEITAILILAIIGSLGYIASMKRMDYIKQTNDMTLLGWWKHQIKKIFHKN